MAASIWKISPEFVDAAPNPSEMLEQADAALVIGDPALRISLKMEALAGKGAERRRVLRGRSPTICPCRDSNTLFVYDVAHQWRELTGKPCVLAIWAGRREVITPEVVADFQASKDMASRASAKSPKRLRVKLDLPPLALERYLTENINFDLDEENAGGLAALFREGRGAGTDSAAPPAGIREPRVTARSSAG